MLAKEYKERLRSRPVRPDFTENEQRKKMIFELKLKMASSKQSPDWSMTDLEKALKYLKKNKSRDHEGFLNEIFKLEVIGDDLKHSLLIMFNKMKKEQMISEFLNYSNITTVPKRGSRLLLTNERGIFRCSVTRSILMRLIYNTKYSEIDRNMSDCQMGGRKGKSCRNNIFIINGIIHDVMKSKKKKPVLLQQYDYSQMFDSMNLQKAISDVYDSGLKDDNLVLIHKANQEINFAVNTPSGLSERQKITNCVLQGDTWGSILASVQVDTIGQDCEESGLGYMYKDKVQVSMLGMVDDIIGVTEAGYKAQQLNAIINMKTAEKGLQFGVSKCKTMLIGKDLENIMNSELTVDKWKIDRKDDLKTGTEEFLESYEGQVPIEKTDQQKYLGFVLSAKGNNLININQMKNKSHGIIRSIFKKLESLNLKQYYFECAIVMMNAMLRSSILYGCESYYDLKESEIRHLERIEEGFLRKLFKTGTGCPITQLYLESGQIPGRFAIIKIRLLFLKNILNENPESMLSRFFKAQQESSSKGDWVHMCNQNIQEINLQLSMTEIEEMSEAKFKNILKKKIKIAALAYLVKKQGSKGGEIEYQELQMADYLLPYDKGLSIAEKQEIFQIRNRMTNIPANFSSDKEKFKCVCGQPENMVHVYTCEKLNSEKVNRTYENIYLNDVKDIEEIYRRFKNNMNKREIILEQKLEETKNSEKQNEPPNVIFPRDPLFPVPCIDNGNG